MGPMKRGPTVFPFSTITIRLVQIKKRQDNVWNFSNRNNLLCSNIEKTEQYLPLLHHNNISHTNLISRIMSTRHSISIMTSTIIPYHEPAPSLKGHKRGQWSPIEQHLQGGLRLEQNLSLEQ